MTIKPIDLQTNIAHMHEIAKGEHGRGAAFIQGQHSLEKSAEEDARRIRNKLEENKHAEKTSIKREEDNRHKKGKNFLHSGNDTENTAEPEKGTLKDENIGLKIDVKR
jgi:hypothetical protein